MIKNIFLPLSYATFLFAFLVACESGGAANQGAPVQPSSAASVQNQNGGGKGACTPALSQWATSGERPVITLMGAKIVNIDVGAAYIDNGATAMDAVDGDLSGDIKVAGMSRINVEIPGDYIIRYSVTDSEQHEALPMYRVVRVGTPDALAPTPRFFSEIDSVWEYMEYLPLGEHTEGKKYPLIIENHGWNHSKRFDKSGRMESMAFVGLVNKLRGLSGDEAPPAIVLTPQRCWSNFGASEVQLLHAFVEWAKRVYPVDENRVYMVGLSMGGWATWEYIRAYPHNIAAAVPIAGGGSGDSICSVSPVPVWAFTARDDKTVPFTDVTWTVESLERCIPAPPIKPKLTVFSVGGHVIDDNIYDLSYLNLGESKFDIYDQNIFDWLMEYSLDTQP